MPPLGKKRTGFGPHPESEHPGQMRLECRSRTAISCDSHERREQHFRRPAEKSGQVLVRTQKANTPARCGWNADRAQPFLVIAAREFLVIAARDASSISDDRQKKRTGFGPHPESEHPGQTRLECRSRTAISCDSRERREQHFRRPAEKRTGFGPHRTHHSDDFGQV
ncbi:MAG: hypothetical protein DME89_13865 [Verrucomicrobia bacterium]|nr:MAG: hypothetical protein DME89_13865 [Verrucomicrobiota bacterium]